MTTIRASCSICGDVELTVDDVEVRICETTDVGEYTFDCPECSHLVRREAEPRIIDLLVASGVRLVNWTIPAELMETHDGPALTHNDLLLFHSLLEDDDALSVELARLNDHHDDR